MQQGGVLSFIIQIFPLLIVGAIGGLIPFSMILKRLGRSRWWAWIAILPFGIYVIPWIVALMRWHPKSSTKETGEIFE